MPKGKIVKLQNKKNSIFLARIAIFKIFPTFRWGTDLNYIKMANKKAKSQKNSEISFVVKISNQHEKVSKCSSSTPPAPLIIRVGWIRHCICSFLKLFIAYGIKNYLHIFMQCRSSSFAFSDNFSRQISHPYLPSQILDSITSRNEIFVQVHEKNSKLSIYKKERRRIFQQLSPSL